MQAKKERRQYFRTLQQSFTEQQYALWNKALSGHLTKVLKELVQKNTLLAAYKARAKEANPIEALKGYNCCFPRVLSSQEGKMEFRLVQDKQNPALFTPGAFGILEPTPQAPLAQKNDIQVCLVPLLAFDNEGRRLGHGKGFYDRFLEGFQGTKIGIAFEWQFSLSSLPDEECDQRLDAVVTEHEVRLFKELSRKN